MTQLTFEPQNEQGAIFAFAQLCIDTPWSLVEIRIQYPDAILQYNGELWNVEFEFQSSNFWQHKHDPRGCDLIVCWHHDDEDCILPVICLSNDEWKTKTFTKCDRKDLEIEYWRMKAMYLQKRLNHIESALPRDFRTGNPRVIEDDQFILRGDTMPTPQQRQRLYEEWVRLGSKNKTLNSVFGAKNSKYLEWLTIAISENHVGEIDNLEN